MLFPLQMLASKQDIIPQWIAPKETIIKQSIIASASKEAEKQSLIKTNINALMKRHNRMRTIK